jgi:ribosomal protein S18 acetylase RimI-like enzyme
VGLASERNSIDALKAQLTRPHSEFLVADDGKRIGGMAFAVATTDPNIVTLHQLYVHPDFQRQGTGRALLEEVVESFPEAKILRVEVEEANGQAVTFYRAQGFQLAGSIPASGGGSGLPGLALEKALG